jgi:hypothetical protein
MHLLSRTHNGIHRAGGQALSTADTILLSNKGHLGWLLYTVVWIQWQFFPVQQIS